MRNHTRDLMPGLIPVLIPGLIQHPTTLQSRTIMAENERFCLTEQDSTWVISPSARTPHSSQLQRLVF